MLFRSTFVIDNSEDCPVTRLHIFSLAGCWDVRGGLFSLSAMINLRPYQCIIIAVFSGATGENSKKDTGLVSSRITWKFVLLQQLAKTGGDESLLISLFFKEMARLSSSKSPSGTLPSLTHYTYKNTFRHANFQVIVVHTGKPPPLVSPLSHSILE